MTLEKRYEPDVLDAEALTKELDALWAELQQPGSRLNELAQAENIDLEQLRGLRREEVLEVREEGKGLSELATALIVAVAPTVLEGLGKLAMRLWENVLLPRIRQRKGKDALEEKK